MVFCTKGDNKMKLIVGLGNPGLTYKKTRHNIGFMFIESLEKDLNLDMKIDKKFKAMIDRKKVDNEDLLFAKPITYMNNSGEAVKSIVDFYQINPEDIIVIDIGKIRIITKVTKHLISHFLAVCSFILYCSLKIKINKLTNSG